MRPRALDLFCSAGGMAMGLHHAGFDVVGVDIRRQPRFPFAFVQADALSLPIDLRAFDLIHASPPCQAYTRAGGVQRANGRVYPDLVAATREMLAASGVPYVIENVPGAPIRRDLILDGWMFPELRVIRERWFELGGWWCMTPQVTRPRGLLAGHGYLCPVGNGTPGWMLDRGLRQRTDDLRRAMGVDWMTRQELSQAIPPAYGEFIGRAFLGQAARALGDAA